MVDTPKPRPLMAFAHPVDDWLAPDPNSTMRAGPALRLASEEEILAQPCVVEALRKAVQNARSLGYCTGWNDGLYASGNEEDDDEVFFVETPENEIGENSRGLSDEDEERLNALLDDSNTLCGDDD